jgi:hypothetical protein
MTTFHDADRHAARSLATEKDIDPEFGLFTEEAEGHAVPSADELLEQQYPEEEVHQAATSRIEFADMPDADAVSKDSEVDPVAPKEEFHGTDLLNGVGHHPREETD